MIGCGYLGSRHLKHLLNLDNVEVSGVWDTDPAALEVARTDFGAKPVGDIDALLDSSDAIDLVTPTTSHYEIAKKTLNSGKPLFIEKPLAATSEEAVDLVKLARDNNLPLQVGHIERFNKAFRSMEGMDLKPQFIEGHRLAPWNPRGVDVAVIHDLMIHDLDLILALSNGEPEHIHANGVRVISNSIDIANARIEFTDGLVANLTASRISLKRMRKMRIFSKNTYVALDMGKGSCEYVRLDEEMHPDDNVQTLGEIEHDGIRHRLYRSFPKAVDDDALRLELSSFRDVVLKSETPVVSGVDGLRALELAENIMAKIKGDA